MDPQTQTIIEDLQRQINEIRNAPVLTPNIDSLTTSVLNNKLDLTFGLSYGDIFYVYSNGEIKRLAPGTSGQHLKTLGPGAAPVWALVDLANGVSGNLGTSHLNSGSGASSSTYWSGDGTWAAITVPTIKEHVTASPVTIQNTTTETDIFSFTLPANTLSTNNAIRSRTLGGASTTIIFNNSSDTLIIQGYYGGTNFSFPITLTAANAGQYAIDIDFWLIANGATNSQIGVMKAHLYETSAGFVNNMRQSMPLAYQTFSIDSTSAQTMKLTAKWSAASSSNRAIFDSSIVDLVS